MMPWLQEGVWDDVSGETFLRKLLSMPVESAKYNTVCSPPRTIYQGISNNIKSFAESLTYDQSFKWDGKPLHCFQELDA